MALAVYLKRDSRNNPFNKGNVFQWMLKLSGRIVSILLKGVHGL